MSRTGWKKAERRAAALIGGQWLLYEGVSVRVRRLLDLNGSIKIETFGRETVVQFHTSGLGDGTEVSGRVNAPGGEPPEVFFQLFLHEPETYQGQSVEREPTSVSCSTLFTMSGDPLSGRRCSGPGGTETASRRLPVRWYDAASATFGSAELRKVLHSSPGIADEASRAGTTPPRDRLVTATADRRRRRGILLTRALECPAMPGPASGHRALASRRAGYPSGRCVGVLPARMKCTP